MSRRQSNTEEEGRPRSWGALFVFDGWRSRPWVVLKRRECSGLDLDRIVGEARRRGGGWLFNYYTYELLYAPAHDVWASTADVARIVRAIEAYPAQRVREFETNERESWLAQGVPLAIVDETAPRPDWRPNQAHFKFPLLVFAEERKGGEYTFLPGFGSFDVLLSAWLREGPLEIEKPLALLVLLTCHGDPAKSSTRSLFSSPLHPNRFRVISRAIRGRIGTDDPKVIEAGLQQELLQQIPGVVVSLRAKPPRPGRSTHSIARSRLAEAVSRELLPDRRKRPKTEAWWDSVKGLEPGVQRSFFRSLTPAERSEVRARQNGKPTQRKPSSSRTLLARAKAKLLKVLQSQRLPSS